MLVRSGAIDVLVIDSVAALVPKAELEGEMGDAHMGVQARLMSQALRKLTGTIAKSQTCVIFINQIRMKIGVMFGNPETTTGGNALKFYASQRLDIRRIGAIKNGEDGGRQPHPREGGEEQGRASLQGGRVRHHVRHGHLPRGRPRRPRLATTNIVEKSGAWFSFKGERIGQGRENAKEYLREHPEVLQQVEGKVLEKFGIRRGPVAVRRLPRTRGPRRKKGRARSGHCPPAAGAPALPLSTPSGRARPPRTGLHSPVRTPRAETTHRQAQKKKKKRGLPRHRRPTRPDDVRACPVRRPTTPRPGASLLCREVAPARRGITLAAPAGGLKCAPLPRTCSSTRLARTSGSPSSRRAAR